MKTIKLIAAIIAITALAGLTTAFTVYLCKSLMLASLLVSSAPNHGF